MDELGIRDLLAGHPWKDKVRVFPVLDSTNLQLKREAAAGASEGSVCIAEEQTAGRGRLGRSFLSQREAGVYLSALLRPDCSQRTLMTLTAQAAVAVRRAICAVCGVAPDIKWVNDLLLGGRKICGILTELGTDAESGRISYAVVGAGVNCNQLISAFPPELQGVAGSIFSQTGVRIERDRLAAEMIRQLSALPGLDWRPEYRAACVTLGKEVLLLQAGAQIPATALDVGEEAELLVRYADGSPGSVLSGEASLRHGQTF